MSDLKPRYPVYVPSKGRSVQGLTAKCLLADETPFSLVVEPGEEAVYRKAFPAAKILVLPEDNMGLLGSRRWIRAHSEAAGAERHWELDDNIYGFWRCGRGKRIPCNASVALRVCEDFTDRYSNIGISGLNYEMFAPPQSTRQPFRVNVHVYSCMLIWNRMPYNWRLRYNDDTDLCLQILAGGLCTVQLNAFLAKKQTTLVSSGGNTDDLYQGDGRLKMARSLERVWPHVVKTNRRFGRPQHVVRASWTRFTTPLKLKPGIDLSKIPPNDYGLKLKVKRRSKSPQFAAWVKQQQDEEL